MPEKTLNINENSVDKAIKTYKNHLSILLMKQKLENVDHFSFKEVSISETEKELRELNSSKVTKVGNIPTKILNKLLKVKLGLVKIVNCGLRERRYLGPKIWNIVPLEKKIQRLLNNSKLKSNLGSQRIVLVIYVNPISTLFPISTVKLSHPVL